MTQRKHNAADLINAALDEDIDPSELSRLAAEFRRQQGDDEDTQSTTQGPGLLKRSLPYVALVAAAALAAFSVYRTMTPLPASTVGIGMLTPGQTQSAPDTDDSAKEQPIRTTEMHDKLRQISNCETDSMRTYPNQSDVRALQFYNLCMTGAGFTPNYSCDTSIGIPAYNPECWTPGKNL